MIANCIQAFHSTTNNPVVKEGFKKSVGTVSLALAIWDLIDIGCTISDHKFSLLKCSCRELAILAGRVAVIGIALTSYPGSWLAGSVLTSMFGAPRLISWFGQNLTFSATPWHPRHVISIASAILSLPSLFYLFSASKEEERPLSDYEVKWISLFNAMTSRANLHLVNQLVRKMF